MPVVWLICKYLRKDVCLLLMNWGKLTEVFEYLLNIHLNPSAQKFEQTINYRLTCLVDFIYVRKEDKAHLTLSKTLLKQEVQSVVFKKTHIETNKEQLMTINTNCSIFCVTSIAFPKYSYSFVCLSLFSVYFPCPTN
jgi:hypothetical protein